MVDGAGKIIREQRIASEPEALIAWFRGLGFGLERIGLEAGPMSQWLYAAMRAAGLAVELLETRHVRDAFKAMPVKSDRNDAREIAQLMRLGWLRPVHCKSMAAQEMRALLTARKAMRLAKRAGMKKAQGGARPQARRDHASHAGRWNAVRFCRCGESTDFGQHRTSASRSGVPRRDDGSGQTQVG